MMKKFLITGAVLATVAALAQTCYKLQLSEGSAADGYTHSEVVDESGNRHVSVAYIGETVKVHYIDAYYMDTYNNTFHKEGYPKLVTNSAVSVTFGGFSPCTNVTKVYAYIREKPYNFVRSVSGWY